MSNKRKRVLAVADFHSGHSLGLTPSEWDINLRGTRNHGAAIQRQIIWDWFIDEVRALRKIDVLIVDGDAVDGKGKRSGGTEQLYPDRTDQCKIAASIIDEIGAERVIMAYGTPYHTGEEEDWEDIVAAMVKAEKIGGEDNIEINGTIINYRHHVGRSTVPHGRMTPIAKEAMWNGLWAERGEYPKANIILRAHVHYHVYCGGYGWLAMTLPSLQGYGTKYGGRRMSGTVDIGFVSFDIYKGGYLWRPHILRLPLQDPVSL